MIDTLLKVGAIKAVLVLIVFLMVILLGTVMASAQPRTEEAEDWQSEDFTAEEAEDWEEEDEVWEFRDCYGISTSSRYSEAKSWQKPDVKYRRAESWETPDRVVCED